MCWIIILNATQYRIFHYEKKPHQLVLVKELQHEAGRLKARDLTSDRSGHYQARSGAAGGTFSERTNPKDNETEHFVRSLAEELETGRVTNQYTNFILIAPPHIDGMLTGHLNKHVQRLMIGNVKKDYATLSSQELSHYLLENWLDIVNK